MYTAQIVSTRNLQALPPSRICLFTKHYTFPGTNIINLRKTWEKLLLAARAIAAVENPADVCVISARPYAQRAILKFAVATGVSPIAGRFTPGTFTNQIQVCANTMLQGWPDLNQAIEQ